MKTLYRESPSMNGEDKNSTKDIMWDVSEKEFVVRNVPYSKLDSEGEELISLGVSVKLELIRELMLKEEIPNEVDFKDVANLEFSN